MLPGEWLSSRASTPDAVLRKYGDGSVSVNLEDEIIRETLVTHAGKVVNVRVAELLTQRAVNV